jgi:predicted nuclease of predicted toxin-antitoxin system
MKFLVDAQLPRRMTGWLSNAGCDAVHTLDLPNGNRSTDEQIIEFAVGKFSR